MEALVRPAEGGYGPRSLRGVYTALLVALVVLLVVTFRDGLLEMERVWGTPEYSHGYLIPFLALYLLLIRVDRLRELSPRESWAGVAVLTTGILAYVVGELSALYIIVQYAFLITVWGIALTLMGPAGVRTIWASLLFLVFLVPLPYFFQYNLSAELQLISSELGVTILRAMNVAVFLEGNVIDLGTYKLQVVEACSGLRYLFPLMSFGFLCAILFRGPVWQRWAIFLASIPITIFMNSFRIAVTGLLVDRFGIGSAEGFLHYFEGWVIFTACLVLMFLLMAILAAIGRKPLGEVFDVEMPNVAVLRDWRPPESVGGPLLAALALLFVGAVISVAFTDRDEDIPEREPFSAFPLSISGWEGREKALSELELETLKLTDYFLADFVHADEDAPVELYSAYYASQRKGVSAHSPRACLPGSGWRIESLSQIRVPGVSTEPEGLPVNRVLIAMGGQRLLVYYWFAQRGRNLTNEYAVKWYIFRDSILRNRTDGALVRLVTPVPDPLRIGEADARLARFLRVAEPRLYYHLPQDVVLTSGGR